MEPTSAPSNGQANGKPPPDDARRIAESLEVIANAASSRSLLIRRMAGALDPRRSIDDECGYPPVNSLSAKDYQELYDGDPIAARVVQILPLETWKVQPTVYESEDSETATAFEEAWDALGKQLRGEGSWYQDERGNPVMEVLQRADVLSGIGHYGIILLGLDDGKPLNEPADMPNLKGARRSSSAPARKLLYLRVFPETLATIQTRETNQNSPRFGQPTMYSVTFEDPTQQPGGVGAMNTVQEVHWTRAIHVVDSPESSELFHAPRIRPVLKPVLNLRKLYGAGPEGYWKSCFTGLSFETPAGQKIGNVEQLRDMYERYINGLEKAVVTEGMTVKTLAPSVVDPKTQIDAQIEAICIKIPVPKRVFMGSERGELSSAQDSDQWEDILKGREDNVTTPRLLVPFVDRLIAVDVLPVPEGYSVEWPDRSKQSAETKAKVAGLIMTALAAYVSGNVESLLAPVDALTKILGWDEEEVLQMLENAAQQAEDRMDQDAALERAVELGLQPDVAAVEEEPPAEEPVEGPTEEEPTENQWTEIDATQPGPWSNHPIVEDIEDEPDNEPDPLAEFNANIDALIAEHGLTDEEVEVLRAKVLG